MDRPSLKLEEQFKSIGVFIEDTNKFHDTFKGQAIGLIVEIGFPADADVKNIEFDIKTVNARGVVTHFTDFNVTEREDQKVLSFKVYQPLPKGITLPFNQNEVIGMAFMDFCWYAGNEAVDASLIPSVITSKQPGAQFKDLGWYLPSRYVDTVVNALGKLNETFLSGTLEDAMLYGPITKDSK